MPQLKYHSGDETEEKPLLPQFKKNIISTKQLYETDVQWENWWKEYQETGATPAAPADDKLLPYYEQFVTSVKAYEESPEGLQYKQYQTDVQALSPFQTEEGFYNVEKAREAGVSEDLLTRVFGEMVLPPPPPTTEQITPASPEQAELEKAIRIAFPEMFKPTTFTETGQVKEWGTSYGIPDEELFPSVLQNLITSAQADFPVFHQNLIDRVGEKEATTILQAMGVREDVVLISLDAMDQEQRVVTTIQNVFPEYKSIEDFTSFLSLDPQKFFDAIQTYTPGGATNSERRQLLEQMDFTPEEINAILTQRKMFMDVDGIRQMVTVDIETQNAYDRNGDYLGEYNWATKEFSKAPEKNIFENFWDWTMFTARTQWENTENFFLSVLPNIIYPEMPEGYLGGLGEHMDATNTMMRERFQRTYAANQKEYLDWVKKNPEIVPSMTYQEGAFKNPDLLKDPNYYAYELANLVPFLVTSIGVTLATGGVGALSVLGIAAMQTPSEAQSVYEDLLAAGAPKGKAADMALVAGSLIGLLESAGRIPLLKQMSGGVFKLFKKKAVDNLIKMTVPQLIKKFGINFTINQFSESITEVAQEAISNAAVSVYDENRSIFDNLPDIFVKTIVGNMLPSLLGAGAGSINMVSPSRTVNLTDAQKKAQGWVQDHKGNWYETTPKAPETTLPAITVPEMAIESVDQVSELQEALTDWQNVDPESLSVERMNEAIKMFDSGQNISISVIRGTTGVTGFIAHTNLEGFTGNQVTIDEIATAPNMAGRGIASRMIEDFLARVRQNPNIKEITAHVLTDESRGLLQKSGFKEVMENIMSLEVTPEMQPSTSVQTGLPGMGIEAAQAELFREVSGKESRRVPLTEVPSRPVVQEGQAAFDQTIESEAERSERVAEEAETGQLESYQKMEEIETLKYFLENDPVATHKIIETVTRKTKMPDGTTKLTQVNRRIGLDRFISIREGTFPSYFTVKEARLLRPNDSWSFYTQKGTPQYNHIPRQNVLDTIAAQLGFDYTGGIDEMVDKIMSIREAKRTIAELQSEIATIPITPAEAQQVEEQSREEPELAPSRALPPTTPPSDNIPLDTNPEPINPTPIQKNIIGLRPIMQGLIKSEIAGNFLKRIVNRLGSLTGIGQLVEYDPVANAAMRERNRVMVTVESQANAMGSRWAADLNRVFKTDDRGGIPELSGIDRELPGAPTIQDVAARFPRFVDSLNNEQIRVMVGLKDTIAPYRQLLEEQGIEVPYRSDVIEGGYYLPRGNTSLEGEEPYRVRTKGRGVKRGFERPAYFKSMADGIEAGYEYREIGTVLTSFAFDAGGRATNTYIANYFKTLNDETGRLIGETVKMRMLRQNPLIAQQVAEINKELNRLKRNIGALTQRQMDVIEMWQNDHEFGDIDTLLDGLEEMAGGRERITLPELRAMYDLTVETLKSLRPSYKLAMRQAQATPRDQGVIMLPELAGRTYPNEIANAVNVILKREGETIGHLSPIINVINVYNNLYRGIRATLDDSVVGIQGLLGMYGDPAAYAGAFKLHILSFASDDVLGSWVRDFDTTRKAAGRLTTTELSKYGLHFAGREGTEFSLGMGNKIGEMWGVKQANRAFANFGDVIRTLWVDHEIETQIRKGRSVDQLRLSDDLDRICNMANAMTGWSTKKALGSLGELVLFAPKFLQARLETVVKAAMGLRPNATLDQQIARNSIIKMIAVGTLLTIAANAMQGEDTDFRLLIQDRDGNWKRNARFMRIKFGGHYYSVFGTWDSLVGLFLNVGTGRLDLAARSMASGAVSNAWDLITGRDYNYNAITENPANFGQWILGNFIPFGISQAGSGFKQMWGGMFEGDMSDVTSGAVNVGAELFGVKSFPAEDWDSNLDKLGLFMYDDDTKLSVEIPRYTWSMFVSDASGKIKNVPLTDVEASTDYPVQVRAVAHTLILKDKYDEIRNWTLISIDEEHYAEYYKQWGDRQRLVDAGDKARYTVIGEMQPDGRTKDVTYKGEAAVKAYDKQHPDVKYGNITQAQYVLLTEYWALNSKDLKEEFISLHPELATNQRYKTLIANPEENAYLALAGYAPVLTKEAYNELHRLMGELDIPEKGIDLLVLPPETSIDTHFTYQEMVSNGTYNTAEARLLLLEDYLNAKEKGVVSYCDWRTENNNPLQVPDEELEYYKLQVDNKTLFDRLDAIREDPALTDRQKRDALAKLRATAVGDQTFADIERRVAVLVKGSREDPIDPKMIDSYVAHMRIVDETSGNSAEARLNRYDDPKLNAFMMDETIWGTSAAAPLDIDESYLSSYLVPRWRIDVKYRTEDAEYNKIPADDAVARAQYLTEHPEYRAARRERDALTMTNSITGERFPLDQITNYVAYNELPIKGYRRDRFLINNQGFADAMHRIAGLDLPSPDEVPDARYDDIYDEWVDTFDQYDGMANFESQYYIEDDRERTAVRDRMLYTITDHVYSGVDIKNKTATAFALAMWEREAYKIFVPKEYVNTYVGWKKLQSEGKPDNWKMMTDTDLWFEDDWFMMENIDFYRNVYLGDLDKDGRPDHERLDFTKVPTRRVFEKYLIYIDLPHQGAKDEYRLANQDLDAWGVIRFDWTPVTEKERREGLTPYERLMEDYWERQQGIEEKLNALFNR